MGELVSAIRNRLRADAGFTLVELLIAMGLIAVALMAIVGTFDSSRKLISGAEQREVATHIAEQELERIISAEYKTIGLANAQTLPTHSTTATHPRYYVPAGGGYQWDRKDASRVEQFVPPSTDGTLTNSSSWTDNSSRLNGEVWRFVTRVYDTTNPNLIQSPDLPDAKRVTVVVTVANGDAKRQPVTLSSVVFDRKSTGA